MLKASSLEVLPNLMYPDLYFLVLTRLPCPRQSPLAWLHTTDIEFNKFRFCLDGQETAGRLLAYPSEPFLSRRLRRIIRKVTSDPGDPNLLMDRPLPSSDTLNQLFHHVSLGIYRFFGRETSLRGKSGFWSTFSGYEKTWLSV